MNFRDIAEPVSYTHLDNFGSFPVWNEKICPLPVQYIFHAVLPDPVPLLFLVIIPYNLSTKSRQDHLQLI